jgi:Phospholipase_D-nuclease N-terminal
MTTGAVGARRLAHMLIGAIAILWLIIWALVLVDIVRRKDLVTSHKVLWALFVLIIPIVGVLVYMVIRPPDAINELASSDAGMRPGDEQFERARDRHPF